MRTSYRSMKVSNKRISTSRVDLFLRDIYLHRWTQLAHLSERLDSRLAL
jgi:hypothetical protein